MSPRQTIPTAAPSITTVGTPKVAVIRGSQFEDAVRFALAQLEAETECEITVQAVIDKADVNRTTLYTKRKHDRSRYVHELLIADIRMAEERRRKLLSRSAADGSKARGSSSSTKEEAACLTELANEVVRQREVPVEFRLPSSRTYAAFSC